jgi:hypothetical protein
MKFAYIPLKGNFMSDNQAQKSTSPSQPAGSQDQKKPETAPKDAKSSYGSDNKSGSKSSASGTSSGSR